MSDRVRLPSLNALRAFEAAGRHLSLRAAAEELFVTPSALSHQIRGLEEQLGVKLFVRQRHGLELTQSGKQLLPELTAGFSRLVEAVAALRPIHHPGILTVSMLSTFAMRWFIPRLHRFQQRFPHIEVRISTSIELVDFEQEGVDCAIRSGQGDWPHTASLRLLDEQFAPVCSPSLITAGRELAQPADLAHYTLLHSNQRPDDWRTWLSSEGLPELVGAQQLHFETRNFAIAAAVRGLGVAIIDPLLVQEELKDGRLIQPFTHTVPTRSAYYLVWSGRRKDTPELAAFRQWLVEEAAV